MASSFQYSNHIERLNSSIHHTSIIKSLSVIHRLVIWLVNTATMFWNSFDLVCDLQHLDSKNLILSGS